ncbi:MAG: anaerobic ribonucleoside-triphosphate reductase activating protein [Thermodesulfobacteriota bacterium]
MSRSAAPRPPRPGPPETPPPPPGAGARAPEIKGFLETSFIDWRGAIAAVVFLPGCNFACPYCHNHQLVSAPEVYQSLALGDVLERLKPFVGWVDGVVVSGGEPSLHPGLAELCGAFQAAGFRVKLDSNGARPAVIEDLAERGLIDTVAMDVKAPLQDLAYRRAAGRPVDLDAIRRSIDFLIHSGLAHEFRSTIWPAWHGAAELNQMAAALEGCQAWTLQALNPENVWRRAELGEGGPYTAAELAHYQATIANPACRGWGR